MDFNFDLNLVQSQKLLLTPQVKQAIEILRMNSQELNEYIQEQVEANPVLEVVEDEADCDENGYEITIDEMNWDNNIKREFKERDDDSFNDINDFTIDKSTVNLSLEEHLLLQLHTSNLNKDQMLISEYLIDNIDGNGYLTVSLSQVAAYFNVPNSKVNRLLEHIQSFDPPGICARNLKECLLLQLRQMRIVDMDIIKIVEKYLDYLGDNRISAVAKSTGLELERVIEIFEFIKTLEPKPGRSFCNNDEVRYIIPDVIVKKIKNKFEVLINEDAVPIVNIIDYYRKIVSEDVGSEAKRFVQNKIDSANWFIKCIEQRKVTLRKVVECLVNKQYEFFERGKERIKPLTMKTVANEIDMHESTVSRTVNGKYIQCSWGIFEIRYFFTGKVSASAGEYVSTENIKMKLRNIIDSEDKKNPLSDNEIAEILKNGGIEISRRTIAKYRDEIGIPAISKRRKFR